MADNLVVYQKCGGCNGTGEQTPFEGEPETCGNCGGTGKILWGWMLEEEL